MGLSTFLCTGRRGDPALYVDIVGKKKAFLFDCGEINIGNSLIKRIDSIFISHTHMDHFIGIDKIFRVCLPDEKELKIYGPCGIISNVEGKLRGYTWNILDQVMLNLKVYEIEKNIMREAFFNCKEGFNRKNGKKTKITGGVIYNDDSLTVKFCELDHKTVSIAYSVNEKNSFNVNKERLIEMKLAPGPWLGDLKHHVMNNFDENTIIEVSGREYRLKYLKESLLVERKGTKITYVTDAIYSKKNCEKIVSLGKNSNVFACEAFFSTRDKERAAETYHLTTEESVKLFKETESSYFMPFHISKRYHDIDEIMGEIKEFGIKKIK